MYEHRRAKLLPRSAFYGRLWSHVFFAVALVGGSLFMGMLGYHFLEALPWIDAFVNAAMLLGGMGPIAELHTFSGKLFAGCYALFAGLVFLIAVGVIFAPVLHRLMHYFHIEMEDRGEKKPADDRKP